MCFRLTQSIIYIDIRTLAFSHLHFTNQACHTIKHALNAGYQGKIECHGRTMISKSCDNRLIEPFTRHINRALNQTGKHTVRCVDLSRNCYGITFAHMWRVHMNHQEFIKFLDVNSWTISSWSLRNALHTFGPMDY